MDSAIRPWRPLGGARLLGEAVTAWCEPGDIGAAIHGIENAGAGNVIVIDAGADLRTAVVGEHLCGVARRRGVAGLVANGAVRDGATLAAWPDFPVFALGRTARGPVSVERGTVNDHIVCGGVPVTSRPRSWRRRRLDRDPAGGGGAVACPSRERHTLEQGWDERLSTGESMLEVFGIAEA
jgi:4-hydroxy-4-methyl-2-oxoglutarate aldolase